MATLPESPDWVAVYQLEEGDPVVGGVPNEATGAGMDNIPHLHLAKRTAWLKVHVDDLKTKVAGLMQAVVEASTTVAGIVRLNNTLTSTSQAQALTAAQGKVLQDTKAPLASPGLTGVPTAPTAATGTDTGQLATTAFVQNQIAASVPDATEANAGKVRLASAAQIAAGTAGALAVTAARLAPLLAEKAGLDSPALAGSPTAPTPAQASNNDRLATTAFVRAALDAALVAATTSVAGIVRLYDGLNSTSSVMALTAAQGKVLQDTKADLASPTFTGAPTAPTPNVAADNERIANTSWVRTLLATVVVPATTAVAGIVRLHNSLGSTAIDQALTAAQGKVLQDTKAPIASPSFTGMPMAPTTGPSNNSDTLATTGWVRRFVLPPGCVAAFATSAPPGGWLRCNGAAISRTNYADLFAAIGTTFGNGDGSTTFNLPDLRGEFVRGWDNGRGADAGRAFGSLQVQADNRILTFETARNPPDEQPVGSQNIPIDGTWSGWRTSGRGPDGDDVCIRFRTNANTEVRPSNVALLYCIKF
ncbi:hypothetical protein EBL89_18410 [Cereibacter sphaeroides]|uniref:phage tail protein n=1 Tax=Cereibacter sphaeroides TaxID=1063 RepID=UPI000F538762|nr:phage tail protein [Cereibacter sphaeroides]AZB57263.1 hypothetical protein EBL89_18410 [Cereibacter sphaeroides]AZB61547.1 hypothetical protein EBL88_18520 [Cereibacter sphaeroides]